MKAFELMSTRIFKCSPQSSLDEAARQMWEHDVGCLVVVDDDDHPIGMITDRDILMAAYTRGIKLGEANVASAMARQVYSCTTSASLSEIEDIMRSARIRRLPVLDDQSKVVGIVTLGDVARLSQSSPLRASSIPGVAKTLAAVCEPRPLAAAAE